MRIRAITLVGLPLLLISNVSWSDTRLRIPDWATAQPAKNKTAAEKIRPECDPAWEAILLGGGSYGAPNGFQGIFAVARLRYLNRVPFAVEAGLMYPEAAVVMLLVDAWRAESWRLHLLDFGILYHLDRPQGFIRPDVRRRWDLVLGLGGELILTRKHDQSRLWLSADLRVFLPDPTTIPFHYGGFSWPIYGDSLKGIQLWIGIGKRFW